MDGSSEAPRDGTEEAGVSARTPVPSGPVPSGAVPAAAERVSRERLELVIRRAAELYAREADTGDLLTEGEVLRIAEELGLPARLARQALFEVPSGDAADDTGVAKRLLGDAAVVASRAMAAPESSVAAAIQEHLIRREYLSVVRHRQGRMKLAPAGDLASAVARGFKRSGKRHLIARSEEVDVAVRSLDGASSHVLVDVDLTNKRREYFTGGLLGGAAVGATVGGAAFAGIAAALGGVGAPEALALASGAGLAGLAAGVGTGLKLAASSFRKRLRVARTEIEGMLDRVEAAASGTRLPGKR
jgi:hypothetical protein